MASDSARIYCRLPLKLKERGIAKIESLKYKGYSEFMREVLNVLLDGENAVVKSNELKTTVIGLSQPYITSAEAIEMKEEFVRFLSDTHNSQNWLKIAYNLTEEKLIKLFFDESGDIDDWQQNDIMQDYFRYTGHSLTPCDVECLCRAFYNDPKIRREMRDYFTARQRQYLTEYAMNQRVKTEETP